MWTVLCELSCSHPAVLMVAQSNFLFSIFYSLFSYLFFPFSPLVSLLSSRFSPWGSVVFGQGVACVRYLTHALESMGQWSKSTFSFAHTCMYVSRILLYLSTMQWCRKVEHLLPFLIPVRSSRAPYLMHCSKLVFLVKSPLNGGFMTFVAIFEHFYSGCRVEVEDKHNDVAASSAVNSTL